MNDDRGLTMDEVRALRRNGRYESQERKSKRTAAMMKGFKGLIDARGIPNNGKAFRCGVMIDRVYGPSFTCRRGVQHFSV